MIEFNTNIPLKAAKVWELLTTPAHRKQWWGSGVEMEMTRGGAFREKWTDEAGNPRETTGIITAFEDDTRLQLNWQDDGWPNPTRVEFLLLNADGGTKIYIQHTGWEMFDGNERQLQVDSHRTGWKNIMGSFKNYCATIR